MYKSLFLIFAFFPSLAFAEDFFFSEQDGKNRTIIYKASCLANSTHDAFCSLKILSVGNKKSLRSCGLTTRELFFSERAMKSGDTYSVSVGSGICGYTNTYVISKSGMTQTKTSPSSKKRRFCSVFSPVTYQMKSHNVASSISLDVSGCESLNILSIE